MPIKKGYIWSENAFISGLKSKSIFRLHIEDDQLINEEKFYMGKRMRAITISHDLNVWAIEDGKMGRLLKLTLE
jgi:glucose/arabinose dehydrogenase